MTTDIAQFAKKALEGYVPQIDKRLSSYFDSEIAKNFGFNDRQKQMVKELLEHSKEHNLRPSKRLRGSFVNYGYQLSGKAVNDVVWQAAMGVELVHTALLMHDDFMDRDAIRRGGPTSHKFFEAKLNGNEHLGGALAIDTGDAILCIGLELIHDCKNFEATKQVLRGVTHTTYGQAYDISLDAFTNWNENDVIVLHQAKTAVYTYQNPLYIGAYLAEIKNPKVFEILESYSMAGGVAFQLQDDILGVFGTPEKTGKSADSDLLQGKCTLMVLNVFEKGSDAQKKAVKAVWGKMTATRDELDLAKKAILDSGSYNYNKKMAQDYARKAASSAAKLREIPGLNEEAIDYIQGIAQYMVTREV